MKRKTYQASEAFFNASVLLEDLSENEKLLLKGGNSDGIGIEENPTEEEEIIVEGHYPDDDPWGGDDPDPEEEEQCTCEMQSTPVSSVGENAIADSNSLLQDLKNTLNTNKSVYESIKESGNYPPLTNADSIARALSMFETAQAMISNIEDSVKTFRIETGSVDGATTKDLSNGYLDSALLLHELFHANQILNGEIGFNSSGNPTMLGLDDEFEALNTG